MAFKQDTHIIAYPLRCFMPLTAIDISFGLDGSVCLDSCLCRIALTISCQSESTN